jgi:hypothetical protein
MEEHPTIKKNSVVNAMDIDFWRVCNMAYTPWSKNVV